MNFNDIEESLGQWLEGTPDIPAVAWPNKSFEPDGIYVEFRHSPTQRIDDTVSGGMPYQVGLALITVAAERNRFTAEANQLSQAIADRFPKGLRLTAGVGNVVINQPASLGTPFPEGAYWRQPIVVSYITENNPTDFAPPSGDGGSDQSSTTDGIERVGDELRLDIDSPPSSSRKLNMALSGSDNLAVDRGGTLYRILGSDILSYVQANIGSTEHQVADIAARDALASNLTVGDRVYVLDATGDATVDTGWAIYTYMNPGFTKIAEEEGLDVSGGGTTNLNYTAAPTNGTVTSSTGTNATLTAADGTNAGLLVPAQFSKLANITVSGAVNLDTLNTASHAAVTTAGSANNNPITVAGQELDFSIANLSAAP